MSWSTSELRVRLARLNRFKPSSKIFYWPFYVFVLSCVCYVFVRVCLYVLCGHLLGKGWPLGSRLWCLLWVCHFPIGILRQVWYLIVSIVSIPDLWSLHPYLLWCDCIAWACKHYDLLVWTYMKVSNGAKIRNRYNQVPHLTQDTNGKVTNSQKTPQTRAKRSALSQQVTKKHI